MLFDEYVSAHDEAASLRAQISGMQKVIDQQQEHIRGMQAASTTIDFVRDYRDQVGVYVNGELEPYYDDEADAIQNHQGEPVVCYTHDLSPYFVEEWPPKLDDVLEVEDDR